MKAHDFSPVLFNKFAHDFIEGRPIDRWGVGRYV
jgi:hypothetical protein